MKSPVPILETDRLVLREWRLSDRGKFAEINSDSRVMEFMPSVLGREESDRLADRIEAHFEQHGFGLWAVETKAASTFIGFVGISIPSFEAAFTPCVEINWRLGFDSCGPGFRHRGGAGRNRLWI